MAGFPSRIARASLGPSGLQDVWPVTDETKAIPARTYKTAWWQIAGMNVAAARGLVTFKRNGSSYTTQYQGLAWDPDNLLPKLVWTRTGIGVYTYSFPSIQYPDENGLLITLSLVGALPVLQSTVGTGSLGAAHHILTGPRSGSVNLFNVGGPAELDDGGTVMVLFY